MTLYPVCKKTSLTQTWCAIEEKLPPKNRESGSFFRILYKNLHQALLADIMLFGKGDSSLVLHWICFVIDGIRCNHIECACAWLCSNCSGNTTSNCSLTAALDEMAGLISADFAICGFFLVLGSYSHVALFTVISDRVARNVRRLSFSNILRQHIGYFDVHFGGELNTRLTQ